MTAIRTDMTMIDHPALGSLRNEFQSAIDRAPNAAVKAEMRYVRQPIIIDLSTYAQQLFLV
jgi:hypothetical protein